VPGWWNDTLLCYRTTKNDTKKALLKRQIEEERRKRLLKATPMSQEIGQPRINHAIIQGRVKGSKIAVVK